MSTAHESLVHHDAPKHRLEYVAEMAALYLVKMYGWRRTTGDLPHSIGLRVPWSLTAWDGRVSITVEEKSIRIVGRCTFPLRNLATEKNRANVERVRKRLRQEIAVQTDVPGR